MTDDLNALLESLHKDSWYLIAFSDGGIVACRHPEKVKKLAVTGLIYSLTLTTYSLSFGKLL